VESASLSAEDQLSWVRPNEQRLGISLLERRLLEIFGIGIFGWNGAVLTGWREDILS